MTNPLGERVTQVWLLLVVLTAISWWLGGTDSGVLGGVAALLILAFFKARLIALHFMELRTAPVWLRTAMETWVLGVCLLLLFLNLSGARLS